MTIGKKKEVGAVEIANLGWRWGCRPNNHLLCCGREVSLYGSCRTRLQFAEKKVTASIPLRMPLVPSDEDALNPTASQLQQ